MSKRAQDDIDRIREDVCLRGSNALKTHVPVTPAGRWVALEMLLNPVYVETCPCCGQDVERLGEPLISREAAMALLEFPDLDSPESAAIVWGGDDLLASLETEDE